MKKVLLFIFSLVSLISIVKAEKPCVIVNGKGFEIGDEIACGTEHFYILENDGNNIKAFAKYNLYVGKNYYEDHIEDIETERVLQSDKAIGAHGGEHGRPVYPEIAVTRFYTLNQNFSDFGKPYGNNVFVDAQLEPESPDGAIALTALNSYEESLKEIGLSIKDKNLITISEINELTKKITGEYLPLNEWSNNIHTGSSYNYGGDTHVTVVGNLKDFLAKKYSWLWSTTYWTRTLVEVEVHESNGYVFFIDTLGDVCEAYECNVAVGAGIRPVITFTADQLNYIIETKTDGNGELKTEKKIATGGEEIEFTVTPNKGYVLSSVKVTDATGKTIIFKNNIFTMPNANVLIEATFEKVNPETSDIKIFGTLILLLTSTVIIISYPKKLHN